MATSNNQQDITRLNQEITTLHSEVKATKIGLTEKMFVGEDFQKYFDREQNLQALDQKYGEVIEKMQESNETTDLADVQAKHQDVKHDLKSVQSKIQKDVPGKWHGTLREAAEGRFEKSHGNSAEPKPLPMNASKQQLPPESHSAVTTQSAASANTQAANEAAKEQQQQQEAEGPKTPGLK